MNSKIILLGAWALIINVCFASLSVRDIQNRMLSNRELIQNYQADVVNFVEGSFISRNNIEQGHIYYKNPGCIRSDIFSPNRHSTVITGNNTYSIDALGNIQLLEREESLADKQFSDPLKILDAFSFVLSEGEPDMIKLIGKPRSDNPADIFSSKKFSRIVVYVDSKDFFAKAICVFNAKGFEIARINIKYQVINKINFPVETVTMLKIGKMSLSVKNSYSNIQINEDIADSIFSIEEIKKSILQKNEVAYD